MRLALAQINPIVGDLGHNKDLIIANITHAQSEAAELVVFGELAITGYPPEDLLLKEHFLHDVGIVLDEIAGHCAGICALVGFPEQAGRIYNSVAVLAEGRIQGVYRKCSLPNYGVFDERRYFTPGEQGALVKLGSDLVGLTICEDIWHPGPPATAEVKAGAKVIINSSASPYHAGKGHDRELMLSQRALDNNVAIAFCNLVGGQDELVFDGHSLVVNHEGAILARGEQFKDELLIADLSLSFTSTHYPAAKAFQPGESKGRPKSLPILAELATVESTPKRDSSPMISTPLSRCAEIYEALKLGLRDYVHKNNFTHVVLGLSGGVDSALVASIAVDALGADRVTAAIMPSPYSTDATQTDAKVIAKNLQIQVYTLPIEKFMQTYTDALQPIFGDHPADLTEENIQARVRGNLLMALSNKFGWLVLTTGNKSEMSLGYTTLYGDMAGGFAVIKDVPKLLVYELVNYRNTLSKNEVIPAGVIQRPPSAELRPDQSDQDSLPEYAIVDCILNGYIEHHKGREALIAEGLSASDIDQVITLVDHNEYKRRQAPPGIKITPLAFGRDRRMPITNGYRG